MVAAIEFGKKPAARREALRESLWPDSADRVWDRKTNVGFATIPRLLPLIMNLISELSGKNDPSSVYLDLWSRCFDEGIVSITDEMAAAFGAGYSSTRAVRTWRERILKLQELGFIEVQPEGNREIAHILILNPLDICTKIRAKEPGRVPNEWWNAFVRRANEIGAFIPGHSKVELPTQPATASQSAIVPR